MTSEFKDKWRYFDKAMEMMEQEIPHPEGDWEDQVHYRDDVRVSNTFHAAIEALYSLAGIIEEATDKLEGLKIETWKNIAHMLDISERHVQRPEWRDPLIESGVVKYENGRPVAFALDLVLFKYAKKREKGKKKGRKK